MTDDLFQKRKDGDLSTFANFPFERTAFVSRDLVQQTVTELSRLPRIDLMGKVSFVFHRHDSQSVAHQAVLSKYDPLSQVIGLEISSDKHTVGIFERARAGDARERQYCLDFYGQGAWELYSRIKEANGEMLLDVPKVPPHFGTEPQALEKRNAHWIRNIFETVNVGKSVALIIGSGHRPPIIEAMIQLGIEFQVVDS